MRLINPTKAARAAAPDLFGQPAYHNTPNHRAALIAQLTAVCMMPAAWALEELIELNNELTALNDSYGDSAAELEEAQKEVTLLEAELRRYTSFFGNVVRAFEEGEGYWPGAAPDDAGLTNAITDTLRRAPAETE